MSSTAQLYNRAYVLTIGAPGNATPATYSNVAKDASYLRVDFDLKKTSVGDPSAGTVSVYNMNRSTRSAIAVGYNAVLSAGYTSNLAVIFTGIVSTVETERTGPDIVTKITLADGGSSITQTTINNCPPFPPDTTTTADLVTYIAKAMGVQTAQNPVPILNAFIDQSLGLAVRTYPRGYSLHGKASDCLNTLLKPMGINWYVDNNQLVLCRIDGALPLEAVELSAQTGMLSLPSKNKDSVVTATSLLNPKLVPGRLVQITSQKTELSGMYKVRTANFSGSTHGPQWQTEIECVAYTG